MTKSIPIVAEKSYDVSIEAVWQAITDVKKMKQWYFEPLVDFQPKVGFEARFTISHEGRDFLHCWKVTEVNAPNLISYEWYYENFPGVSKAVWELEDQGDSTLTRISHYGQETFPQDDPIFSRESCQSGWNYFLGESLADFIGQE